MKNLGKRSTQKRGEIAEKTKGADGNIIQKYPTLRVIIVSTFSHLKILKFWIPPDFPMNNVTIYLQIGFKVTRPTVAIHNYDAWYKAVELCTYDVPKLKLSSEEYR